MFKVKVSRLSLPRRWICAAVLRIKGRIRVQTALLLNLSAALRNKAVNPGALEDALCFTAQEVWYVWNDRRDASGHTETPGVQISADQHKHLSLTANWPYRPLEQLLLLQKHWGDLVSATLSSKTEMAKILEASRSKEMYTFIQQGRITLIKRDIKDIYNVSMIAISNKCCFLNFLFIDANSSPFSDNSLFWDQNRSPMRFA